MTKRQAAAQIRAEYPHFAILHDRDETEFQNATLDFADDRDRARLIRRLLKLGIHAEAIRWHVANPGSSVASISDD